jgi:RHS repeat-associated protein
LASGCSLQHTTKPDLKSSITPRQDLQREKTDPFQVRQTALSQPADVQSKVSSKNYSGPEKIPAVMTNLKPLDLASPPTMEQIMAAGQLGGQLYPTHSIEDPQLEQRINLSFGTAIQEWNKHEYKRAVQLFKKHINEFPESPWKAEAVLHMGCDAQYNGRYSEANSSFNSIIQDLSGGESYGSSRMTSKAMLRLGVLNVFQNNFATAATLFSQLLKSSDDWRERTYASYWLQRINAADKNKLAMLNCGTMALAHILENDGKTEDARSLREVIASSLKGQSMAELQEVASAYGYSFNAVKIRPEELPNVPLPSIVQLTGRNQGDSGHYWILERTSEEQLAFFDPQAARWFYQTPEEFAQEWDGNILVIADAKKSVAFDRLTAVEASTVFGGCCGVPRAPDFLGDPNENVGKNEHPGSAPCNTGYGAPAWKVNILNLNLFMTDTPLWYDPPIGPSVHLTLSYNSQSSITFNSPFGNKWQLNYASYLVVDSGGQVTIVMPDGRYDIYSPTGNTYLRPPRVYNTLTKVKENHFTLQLQDGTVYEYDIPTGTKSMQPFLVKITDRHGQSVTLGYDANIFLTRITDALGQFTSLFYDGQGHVNRVADPFGREALFDYDASGNLASITDMGGYTTTLAYDATAYVTTLENPRGQWQFLIEPSSDVGSPDIYPPPGGGMLANYRITITDPLGGKEEYFYYGGCDDVTCAGSSWYVSPKYYIPWESPEINNFTSNSMRTRYYGDSRFSIIKIIHPDGGIERFAYDDPKTNRRTGVIDQHGHQTLYTYNSMGNVTSVTDPKKIKTDLTYAANNIDLTGVTNGLGTLQIAYDASRNVESITNRLGKTISFVYDSYGRPTLATDPAGSTAYAYYEPSHASRHQLKEITRDGKTLGAFTYDAVGRVATRTDATGLTLGYTYDNLNRVTSINWPDSRSETINYAGCCPWLVESTTDRSGATTGYEYDPLKRLIAISNPDKTVVRLSYDANGNLAKLEDQSRTATTFEYDAFDRLTKKKYADGQSETYTYDVAGLPATRKGARNITSTFTFDENHNRTKVVYSDGTPTVEYVFDNYNRPTSRTDGVGTWGFSWDAESRLIGQDGPWSNDNLVFTYDDLGRRGSIQQQGGDTISYRYDTLSRLSQVQVGSNIFRYGYSANSPSPIPTLLTRPNGSTTSYAIDNLNRLTGISEKNSAQQVITSNEFTYNSQDLRDTETITNGTPFSSFTDKLITYTYNNLNQLLSATNPAHTFIHDAEGNLTQGFTPEGYQFTATYDGENRLTGIDYTDGNQVSHQIRYNYSGDSFLAMQTIDGVETRFLRSGLTLLQERDASNTTTRAYVWNPAAPGGIGGLLQLNQNAQPYNFLYDGKGNVRGIIDASQNIAATYSYDPFGVLMAKTGTLDQPYRFSTKGYDEKTGLSYYGYRFYSPVTGRWVNRDPLGEKGGLNHYGFVQGNPSNFIDPSGEFWWMPVAGGLAGGVANAWSNYDAYHSGQINGEKYWGAIVYGAVFGGVSAIMPGYKSAILAGASLNGINNFMNQKITCENSPINKNKLQWEFIAGGAAGGGAKALASASMAAIIRNSVPALQAGKQLADKATSLAESYIGFWLQQTTNIVDVWQRSN